MNKEEKEAIDRIQKRIKDNEDYLTNQVWLTEDVRCAIVVLNLIEKQEKIINNMTENYKINTNNDICVECKSNSEDCHGDYCKEALIEYFKKENEGGK